MPTLWLNMLGPLELRCGDEWLAKPPTLKSQSLLAYLALHRDRPLNRDHLAELFWGDRPERKARRSLTTALWHIRRCLPEPDILLTEPQTLQFDPQADLALDAEAFEAQAAGDDPARLAAAAALYRGDLLEGFYDDWIMTARRRLEALFCDLLTRLMGGQERAGEHEAALATALQLLARDPLREDAHRLAMRALCRLGRRNAALEQYRRCQERVQQELGAEPMAETGELYRAILEGRFEVGQPVAPIAAAGRPGPTGRPPAPAATDPLDPLTASPLVGREREMEWLEARWREALARRGGLVLIGGEAGVGKTRLAEELSGRLRWQGASVLWGRCFEFEGLLPYQPVAEALRGVVPAMTPAELAEHPPWVLAEVARLVPELVETVPALAGAPGLWSEGERMRLFEGLTRFLAALTSPAGLVLVLEDLHWATESTLQLLHYLARHLATQPALMVATFRPEAVGRRHPLAALPGELVREGLARPLSLAPLSLEAVEALVAEMSGSGEEAAPLARRLYHETEGNPFFLTEMVKALFEAGWITLEGGRWRGDFTRIRTADLPRPAGVSETIEARVRGLEDDAQQLLRLAAVLGREFDLEPLEALWERGEGATLEALERLLRRRLIVEGSGALGRDYAFAHHKIQEVVYAGIPARHRRRLHGWAGLAMERLAGPATGEPAGELAFHFQEGARDDEGMRDKAIAYLLRAGDEARLAQAHEEATGYYEQALRWLKAQGRHELAARTLFKLGLTYHGRLDFERAREAYDEGFRLWQRAAQDEPAGRPAAVTAPHALRSWQMEPATLDPSSVSDWHSGVVLEQLFSSLIRFGPDMEVVPEAASRWEVQDGGRRYVFYLQEDGRWSDGAPVTAADFVFAWKRFLEPSRGPVPATFFYLIRGARAYHRGETGDPESVAVENPDPLTLVVELEYPDPNFLHLTLYALPVPRRRVEADGDRWIEPGRMVSNGPFQLVWWRPGESMGLVRNPHYPGRFTGNLEAVELFFGPYGAAMAAYDAGNLDLLTLDNAPPAELDRARQRHPGDYLSVPDLATFYLQFDLSRPPFDDRRVRRALTMATDRRRLADEILGGYVFPATGGQVPPAMAGHSAGIALPYEPEQARRLLAEAGYESGRALPAIELLLAKGREAVVEELQAQWQATLGVEVRGRTVAWGELLERLHRDPPALGGLATAAIYPDPATFVRLAQGDEGQAAHTWRHAEYERLVAEAKQATDRAARLMLVQQMDRLMVDEAWTLPLWYGRRHLLVKPWVTRLPTSPIMGCFWKDVILEPH